MANRISVTLDLSKIDKSKIEDRKYTTKDGVEHSAKQYRFDLIETQEKKKIKQGDGWAIYKTHFAVESRTKEEREQNVKSSYIGEGTQFLPSTNEVLDTMDSDDGIPF